MRLPLAFALALCTTSVQAQQAWDDLGGPPGGILPVLFETASGTMLARDEIGAFARSTDAGTTWQAVPLAGVNAVSEASGELLAATVQGAYRSTDEGMTWAPFRLRDSVVVNLVRGDAQTLFANLRSGLYRSADDGTTWTREVTWTLSPVSYSSTFRYAPPHTLTRARDGHIYRLIPRSCAAFIPCRDVLRWTTGAAWDTLTTNADQFAGELGGLDTFPDGRLVIALWGRSWLDFAAGGLYIRALDGRWSRFSTLGQYASALVIRDDGKAFVGGITADVGPYGVYELRGDSLARVWTAPFETPITTLGGRRGALIAGTGIECFSTIDGTPPCSTPSGAYRIAPGTFASTRLGFGGARLFTIAADSAGHVQGIARRGQWAFVEGAWVQRDPERELTRGEMATHLAFRSGNVPLVSLDYWYGPGHLTRSPAVDPSAGTRWEPIRACDSGRSGLEIRPDTLLAVSRCGAHVLFRTPPPFPPGFHANKAGIAGEGRDAARSDSGLFVAATSGLYRSSDRGLTWTRTLTEEVRAVAAAGAHVWAVGESFVFPLTEPTRVYHSADGGRTWRTQTMPCCIADVVVSASAVAFDGLTVAYVQPLEKEDVQLLPLPDFSPSAYTLRERALNRLVFDPEGYLYVATEQGLLRSRERFAVANETTPSTLAGKAPLHVGPNPFRETLAVTVTLAVPGDVRAEVFDALGRRVALLHDGPASPGTLALRWQVGDAAPGVYVLRVQAGPAVETARLVRLR